MAFVPYSYDDGQPRPSEYYKTGAAGDLTIGLCMALTEGEAALSQSPTHICLRTEAEAPAGTLIPLMPIDGGIVFEAPLAAGADSLAPGGTAAIAADGLSIAAGSGPIRIVSMDGTAAGDLCRCRFA